MRWLTPPPQRTAYFSRARRPGRRLAGVADLGLGALQGVRPGARGGRDAGEAAQQVERAALGGEQVAGAGGDGQQLLAGLDPVAVLDVPLDLELVGADDGERPPRRSAGRRPTPASRAVKSAVATASSGTVATVVTSTPWSRSSSMATLAMSSTCTGSRPASARSCGERGVEAALQRQSYASSSPAQPQASPQPPPAQPGAPIGSAARHGARGRSSGCSRFCHCSWGRCGVGRVGGKSAVSGGAYGEACGPGSSRDDEVAAPVRRRPGRGGPRASGSRGSPRAAGRRRPGRGPRTGGWWPPRCRRRARPSCRSRRGRPRASVCSRSSAAGRLARDSGGAQHARAVGHDPLDRRTGPRGRGAGARGVSGCGRRGAGTRARAGRRRRGSPRCRRRCARRRPGPPGGSWRRAGSRRARRCRRPRRTRTGPGRWCGRAESVRTPPEA